MQLPRYDTIGHTYSQHRREDPSIAALLTQTLGDARSVINVGAGTGNYEPAQTCTLAVEPSDVMIRQRPAHKARCVQGVAEALPAETNAFDAALTVLSMHHWTNPALGLRELARVAIKRVVILTWVPDVARFWLTDEYFPEVLAHDRTIFPAMPELKTLLEANIGPAEFVTVPLPHDCIDGMLGAYWRRPEAYLSERVRSGISSFARIDVQSGLAKLEADLASGAWQARHSSLLSLDALDVGYRIACCEIKGV